LLIIDKKEKIVYYIDIRNSIRRTCAAMLNNDQIEVCQLRNPGGMGHGKWYVSRGSGRNAKYLRQNGTWHADTSMGGFFWSTLDEAEKAKQTVLEQESAPPP
jgi:hypothetical protein